MPVFPSPEWIDAFCHQLTAHPRSADVARSLGGVYRFVVEPGEVLPERQTYEVLIAVDGDVTRARQVTGSLSPRITVRTDYRRWRQLLLGQLDLGPAVLFGRLRVSGDVGALLAAQSDADVLLDALRGVDTLWLDAT